MRIFFDMEFTGLHQNTTPISLGMVAEDGHEFYAEFVDYDHAQVDEWISEHVISHLNRQQGAANDDLVKSSNTGMRWEYYGTRAGVAVHLRDWLSHYDTVEIWSDVLAYDWVLFCDLFGGAFGIPSNIFYIPFDLATLFLVKHVHPDVSREIFAGESLEYQHHALHDAKVIKTCFEKVIQD